MGGIRYSAKSCSSRAEMIRADVAPRRIILTDIRLAGMRGKACPQVEITGEESALARWYDCEPTHRDEADLADALHTASRAGLPVSASRIREITVSTAPEIRIDTRELVAEISFYGLHFYNPSSPDEVYQAPVFRHREACRRVHKWARTLAKEALEALTFASFYEAVSTLLNRAPAYTREISSDPQGEYADALDDALLADCPF